MFPICVYGAIRLRNYAIDANPASAEATWS